jgi:hypothetical protein
MLMRWIPNAATEEKIEPKFIEPLPFADPDAAARKLMELANAVEPVQDGRIYIERKSTRRSRLSSRAHLRNIAPHMEHVGC